MTNDAKDPAIPAQAIAPKALKKGTTVALSAVTSQLRSALRNCADLPQIAAVLASFSLKHFSAAIVRVDYREGVQSRIALASAPTLSQDLTQKLSDKCLHPMAIEVQTDDERSARVKAYKREDQTLTVFAAPIVDQNSGLAEGAISVLFTARPGHTDLWLTHLDAMATIASMRLAELAVAASPKVALAELVTFPRPAAVGASPTSEAALGKMASNSSPKQFAYNMVNSLANQLGAEQVGFGTHNARRIQVIAISSIADFKANSPGVALMQQSMEECLDHKGVILHQPGAVSQDGTQFAIHRRWAIEAGGACLFSVPLNDADGVVAIVSIRRPGNRPFAKEELAGLMQMLQPYGSALRMLEKASRSLTQQLKSAWGESLQRTFGRSTIGRKVLYGCLAAVLLWCCFGTLTYTPMCNARVVAENMVQMTSSFEAQLKAVHIQPGEQVKAGQLLVEFNTTDLNLQLQALERDIVASEVEVRRAVDARDTSSAAVAKARVGVLMTQAASIQQRLENSRLVAPTDGVVVRADVEKRIGQMFSPGQPVIEFASTGGWVLEIQVPDDIGTLVTSNQTGTFAAASLTSHSMPFEIKSVEGTAQVVDGKNVFIAHAPLGERPDWMKSGMEGTAKVTTVPKPVWWVGLHRVIDWCRLSFWI